MRWNVLCDIGGCSITVTRCCGISGWMCDITVTSLTVLALGSIFGGILENVCHRQRQYWFWDRPLSRFYWCLFYLHQLNYFKAQVEISRISTNLETLKSSKIWVSDEKPPAKPCPRDLAASFPSSCPWHGVGRLPNRNGSWKNSYLWFFSRCCDEVVFVRKSVHSWQTCTKWPLGEGLGFVAPFTRLCCGGGGTGGRVTIQVSISYFSIVLQMLNNNFSIVADWYNSLKKHLFFVCFHKWYVFFATRIKLLTHYLRVY